MALRHTPHTVCVIDQSAPSELDERENESLLQGGMQYMRDENLYETPEEFQHRVDVLQLLLELVPHWVMTVAEHLGRPEAEIEAAHGFVFSYGSFRLSTHGPGDDIDTLCVGPAWCSREHHFFGQESYCLEAMLRKSNWVSKVQAVPEAYVPVLKLEIRGIDIDLPYATLPMNELPMEIDLQDNSLLRDMDPTSVTSINGCRVTDKLVQLNTVNGKYRQAFQDALRFLKMWAKRRGIYSNVMGFLGGVNFAILTTRTCLHYPNACAATIVRNFFRLFAAWDWAGAVPVMVTGIDRGGPASDMVWDPTISMHQGREIFPIITPCYPASNSTFNVSDCTKGILISELQRGRDIVAKYPLKKGAVGAAVKLLPYAELAEPVNFLGPGAYANYLQVIAAASSNEDFNKWAGYMNARIKHFVSRLHNTQGMLRARPWPKEFPLPMSECSDGRQRTSWLIGLTKTAPANGSNSTRRIDIRSTIHDFKAKCETWAGHGADMTLEVKHVLYSKLPEYLAVHGRAAVQKTAKQESASTAAPSAATPSAAVQSTPAPAADAPAAATPAAAAPAASVPAASVPAASAPAAAAPAASAPAASAPTASAPTESAPVEQKPLAVQSNSVRVDAPSTAPTPAAQVPDTKLESENVESQNKADSQAASAEKNERKLDASVQEDQECAADAGGDASGLKGDIGGSGTASPVGAKRKRDEADVNQRVQRISSHAC